MFDSKWISPCLNDQFDSIWRRTGCQQTSEVVEKISRICPPERGEGSQTQQGLSTIPSFGSSADSEKHSLWAARSAGICKWMEKEVAEETKVEGDAR